MDTEKMKQAMAAMVKAIDMMEQAMNLKATEEDTTSSTGFMPGTGM